MSESKPFSSILKRLIVMQREQWERLHYDCPVVEKEGWDGEFRVKSLHCRKHGQVYILDFDEGRRDE